MCSVKAGLGNMVKGGQGLFAVMPGLVPGIHVFLMPIQKEDVDGRDEPAHDE
jgi:hypothetical protein